MAQTSFRFSHAIVRLPGARVAHGLRAEDTGAPDLERFLADQAAYVAALVSAGPRSASCSHWKISPIRCSSKTRPYACLKGL